jgi:EAL domain-containing protein (putative c-di-GMP-specific phosphodiesterase class I)
MRHLSEWLVPPDHHPQPLPGFVRTPRPPAVTADDGWTIGEVIDRRAIRTLFQKVIHLDSGEVVGFEALSRGPVGTSLESPLALLAAARDAGRLGELDWLCRAQALVTAATARLGKDVSWLVNVEPAGLALECPQHLRPLLDAASRSLRVILEVVERDVEGHVTNLLHTADKARQDSWGVALDDVGAEEGSLALLPFLRPDLVKLDMSLVRDVPQRSAAAISSAVLANAERTGAVILAEGIETAEQERLARVFGATYAQGYRYGRPGPLPASLPSPVHPIPLRQRLAPLGDNTPFDVLSEALPVQQAAKSELLHISQHLEGQAGRGVDASVLLACFQDRRFFSAAKRARYEELSTSNALTVVLADDLDDFAGPRYHTAAIKPGSRLGQEWVVIVINPHYSAAFVARDCADPGPDGGRRFDYVYTHDRDAVVCAARAFLKELRPAP